MSEEDEDDAIWFARVCREARARAKERIIAFKKEVAKAGEDTPSWLEGTRWEEEDE